MSTGGVLELDRRISLDLSFYPSFMLPYIEKTSGDTWVITAGSFKGAVLRIKDGRLLEYKGIPGSIVSYITGAWLNPFKEASKLPRSARSRIHPLLEAYSELGLSINPVDRDLIFVSVFLSRSTDFHRNTVKWCRAIATLMEESRDISSGSLSSIGSSYQLKQLPRALSEYYSVVKPLEEGRASVDEVKKALLGIGNVGVKTAIAYLLFTNPSASHLAPYDTHFASMIRRLNLIDEPYLEPRKEYCRQYTCSTCPLRDKCIVSITSRNYGGLSGWIQTALYIHDKTYCRRSRCSKCPLRKICIKPVNHG